MIDEEKDVVINLWWMKEHGVGESWAKLYNVVLDTLTFGWPGSSIPWCTLKNGKVVFKVGKAFYSYDAQSVDQTFKKFDISAQSNVFSSGDYDAIPYIETLVSPYHFSNGN
ncbi:hypothetical protein Tsubulata_013132 [Turnera subulata]|uniref:F-box associated domain-containing protein n=1 Tax=Turnera subulata TaxID=218843 RepID=A0A9Q0J654_9ROSI|nr:hypothetical protein Tsubulata_013132 [Turnera subulata]